MIFCVQTASYCLFTHINSLIAEQENQELTEPINNQLSRINDGRLTQRELAELAPPLPIGLEMVVRLMPTWNRK